MKINNISLVLIVLATLFLAGCKLKIDIENNIAASSGAGISLLAHVEFSEEVRDATFVDAQ